MAVAALARLVGEDHAAEGAVEEVLLVEQAGGVGRGGDCHVDAQHRIARHALGRGTQRSRALAVVDVAQGLRDLLVATTHAVGHLHLGHVDVLGACAQLLAAHGVLDEGRVGHVGRRIPKRNVGTHGLLLVGRLRLHHLLPLHELLQLAVVVDAEVATHGFHQSGQLALARSAVRHKIGHHAAQFLPRMVGVDKLGAADVCAERRHDHRQKRLAHVFRHLREQKRQTFHSATQSGHRRSRVERDIVVHIVLFEIYNILILSLLEKSGGLRSSNSSCSNCFSCHSHFSFLIYNYLIIN